MPDRRESVPRTWRRTTAQLRPTGLTRAAAEQATTTVELWESSDRAYLRSTGATGEPIRELSAGRYFLREVDHRREHQVLRTGFGLEPSLEVVRSAMPSQAVVAAARSASAEVPGVALSVRVTAAVGAGPPPRARRATTYSWELYAHRELGYVARILAVDVPAAPLDATFESAFLYGSAWLETLRAHVVWTLPDQVEVELVVSNTDPETVPVADAGTMTTRGPVRSVALRSEAPELVQRFANALPVAAIVSVEEQMPRGEPDGRIVP